MTKKDVLRLLAGNGISSVMIGGLALRMYNSPRVTHDMDLAISALDIDALVPLMYGSGFLLITSVSDRSIHFQPSPDSALAWAEQSRPESLTFVEARLPPGASTLPTEAIDITTEVDFLFDLVVPFPRLREHAREVRVDDLPALIASVEDLLILKESRREKSAADLADIQFLKEHLND
jgi:predicted nucleotidyltransferase